MIDNIKIRSIDDFKESRLTKNALGEQAPLSVREGRGRGWLASARRDRVGPGKRVAFDLFHELGVGFFQP